MPLDAFSAPTREWFETTFPAPTAAQRRGWPAIASGEHTLICAPTGSGKTLAAFLWALDRLATDPVPGPAERCRVLYVSPLRALAVDVDRNLRAPLLGTRLAAERLGVEVHQPTVAVRTGDTPAAERRAIAKTPPDVLITTPESLYLMLTSRARDVLAPVRWVIVDEIHAVAATKRGSHLMVSLERLERVCGHPVQRIGLSATQRPLTEIARFLGGRASQGPRPVTIVDAGVRKDMEVEVVVGVEDMSAPGDTEDRSIWPSIHPRLLDLIREHRSTIVFTNARRLAERLAARLNELAGEDLVRAHHGSLAREQRTTIEDDLKAGRLRGLVATSSLELGIDMGAVDLVVQVESPGSVARGLQRIGRAGHSVSEPSRGKVFPKYRGDLLEAAVVVRRMGEGAIEETRYPRNPLDVCAQQIVAMVAMDDWKVDELADVLRRAAPFADMSDEVLHTVLDMLSGRYPSAEFAELRPRVVWDRRTGELRSRAGAHRLAVTSGGTIPDRGLFGVFLPDGSRVGELDEEMVYESRPGDVFVLGASTWRMEDITHDRVIVTPAPGEPAKMPFWRGDRPGRPLELGRALGAAVREIRSAADPERVLRDEYRLDELAARNLVAYLDEQAEATGAVPDDRTVVVERFPDEIGDWRVCVLSPFGARVHAPWAMALETRLSERLGGVQVLWSDDGIVLRLPEAVETVPLEDLLPAPEEAEELVTAQLPGTALFSARFREAAARALLLPRRDPRKRTPLWQQRQRASDLLSVAARYPDFPILLETTRECLRDVFDMPALREVLSDIRSRRVRVVTADTRTASPFAQSLLFGWVAVYMYEGDAPLAERRATALSLDRDLMRELLGAEELRELIDPEALASLELELQCLAPERRARDHDELHDVLRKVGDLTRAEVGARSEVAPDDLLEQRRAIEVSVAGESRIAAAEDAARLRDALGVALPPGLPAAFTQPVPDALLDVVGRYARTHGPFTTADVAARFGAPPERVRAALAGLEEAGRVVRGEFRPSGTQTEWCDAGVLRALRRRSLAVLRREIEPVGAEVLGRFLPAWHGIDSPARGPDALLETVAVLQGAAIPASALETDVLPLRVAGYRPADLDELCASGSVVWTGAGSLGATDGRVCLFFRDQVRLLAPPATEDLPAGPVHDAIRHHLTQRGASFWLELVDAAGHPDPQTVLAALWDLVWSGEVTNDTPAPLRALGSGKPRAGRGGRPRPGRLTRLGPPAAAGRWSLVSTLTSPAPSPTQAAHARALQLLDRHGVLTREAVLSEGAPGGFAGVYGVLRMLEESGRVRRGWFVDGLGAAQFALPGAVDRLRSMRETASDRRRVHVLAATDPAQPYGAALPWPPGPGRPARAAGAHVVLDDGVPAAFVERGGRSVVTFGGDPRVWSEALVGLVKDGRAKRIELNRVDSQPAQEHAGADALREAGFVDSYRGLVLRG